jgi:hypothetical protein
MFLSKRQFLSLAWWFALRLFCFFINNNDVTCSMLFDVTNNVSFAFTMNMTLGWIRIVLVGPIEDSVDSKSQILVIYE